MRPKTTSTNQFDLFRAHFKQILNPDHQFRLLADGINWSGFGAQFIDCYSDDMGRPALRKRKKRRSAVEPKIGHMKSDNRMNRNYLKGVEGGRVNALLTEIGANLRKLLAPFDLRYLIGPGFTY